MFNDRDLPKTHVLLAPAAAVFLALTFVNDVGTELGIASGVPYIVPVLLTLWAPNNRHTWVAAAAGSVLIAAGFMLSPETVEPYKAITNRGMSLFAVWVTAIAVSYQHLVRVRLNREVSERRAILDHIEALFVAVDGDGAITMTNGKTCRMVGKTEASILGSEWSAILVAPGSRAAARQHVDDRRRSGSAFKCENALIREDGAEATIAWEVVFHGDGFLLSGIDITDRVQAEAILRKRESLARLGEMAAVIAHEVKNPLAGVGGVLQAVGRGLPDSRSREMLESAHQRLMRLGDGMERLLHYAQPRVPNFERVNLLDIAERACNGVEQISLSGENAWVFGDSELLEQAIGNLLTNAVQAVGETGSVRVVTAVAGLYSTIEVIDDGPGMSDDVKRRLFEPFFTTRVQGSGLGLAIAQRTVDAHQGTIELDSSSAQGSTFILRFPTVRPLGRVLPASAPLHQQMGQA